MSEMINGIGWFEVGTGDLDGAQKFYGDVFGWRFEAADNPTYRYITTPAADSIRGGAFNLGGEFGTYAIFYVLVADAEAACRSAEAAGGKVLVSPQRTPSGLTFAHVLDPAGNRFGVFTPAPAQD